MKTPAQSGFTLLELMVVILIIGLGLSVISVAIGKDEVSAVRTETETFISKAGFVAEQAVLNREIVGLFIEPRSSTESTDNQWCYRWQRFRNNNWQDANENLTEHCLPVTVQLDLVIENELYEFDPELDIQPPVLVFYPSGEATLFEMALFPATSGALREEDIQRIEINMMGELQWLNRERELENDRLGRS